MCRRSNSSLDYHLAGPRPTRRIGLPTTASAVIKARGKMGWAVPGELTIDTDTVRSGWAVLVRDHAQEPRICVNFLVFRLQQSVGVVA